MFFLTYHLPFIVSSADEWELETAGLGRGVSLGILMKQRTPNPRKTDVLLAPGAFSEALCGAAAPPTLTPHHNAYALFFGDKTALFLMQGPGWVMTVVSSLLSVEEC